MRILCLDLGTQTGWASCDDPKLVNSGTISFASRRYEGGGMRFLRFQLWLDEYYRSCPSLRSVYFEEVRAHKGTDAAHIYGGLLATLTAWCEKNGVAYSGIPVGEIKKHATGKGNSNKEAMIEAAKKLGYAPQDDNEADALCLLHCALDMIGGSK